jgi:uroporphyrinogen decarboxylase
MADRMTPKERAGAFFSGQPTDRLMCVPLILNHAARVAGITVSTHARSGEQMGRAHAAAFRRYGQDLVTIFSDTAIVAEAMGTRLHYPEDDVPRFEAPAIEAPEQAADLAPVGPDAGRLPVYLEAIETANAEVGEEVFVSCCYAAPFTTAAMLMGTDLFVRALHRNPDAAHALLTAALETTLAFTQAVLAAGGLPVLVDPAASCSLIGPHQYEEFAAPYTSPLVAAIHAASLPAVLHICGRSNLIWSQMADSGADCISIDKEDLAEVKAGVQERVCLFGNVAPVAALLCGTPQSVDEAVRECIAKGGDSAHGFIVGSGCEVPIETPPENLDAMMAGVRKYGAR